MCLWQDCPCRVFSGFLREALLAKKALPSYDKALLSLVVFFSPWASLRDDCVNRDSETVILTETVILCLLQQHKN